MFRKKSIVMMIFAGLLTPGMAFGQAAGASADSVSKIIDEGTNRSQAMATIRYLTDVIGPRLTNSPGQRRANQWTKQQLEKWGIQNAKVDPWGEFGRGWEMKHFSGTVTANEQTTTLRAYPKAWSPSTNGPITAPVIYVDATDDAGLEKYKGKLKGAIILTQNERPVNDMFKAPATRQSDEALNTMENAKPAVPGGGGGPGGPGGGGGGGQFQFNQKKMRMYFEEGAAALFDSGGGVDAGTIRVMGASLPPAPATAPGTPNPFAGTRIFSKGAPATIPQFVLEVEQYNRLVRLAKAGVATTVNMHLQVEFYDDDLTGYNTIAEIPGTDPVLKDEIVMVGGHLDSWHAGTGATDNGAGVTASMEALRIIQASGLKPRRTIRIGLWTGEEQGLMGARGYVAKTLGEQAPGQGPNRPIVKKPGHDKFAAYYNLDNGTGQIRGIYLQGNEQLRSTFKNWLTPFKDWKATTVTINNTGGTDHLAFDAVGVPGFQFIQDPIEYQTRSWHTTQDVSDRILEEDLKRSAVIMAVFAYSTAMMDERLPRKQAQPTGLASLYYGLDVRGMLEDASFRGSSMDFAICGHAIDEQEIPQSFPKIFALQPIAQDHSGHAHAE